MHGFFKGAVLASLLLVAAPLPAQIAQNPQDIGCDHLLVLTPETSSFWTEFGVTLRAAFRGKANAKDQLAHVHELLLRLLQQKRELARGINQALDQQSLPSWQQVKNISLRATRQQIDDVLRELQRVSRDFKLDATYSTLLALLDQKKAIACQLDQIVDIPFPLSAEVAARLKLVQSALDQETEKLEAADRALCDYAKGLKEPA